LNEVRNEVAKRGNPPWISAEGTNIVPTGMAGEATMETYLGKMFNHGAVMVNIFSWGIGGEAQKNNFFRRATENAEALSAYCKFLSGGKLQELTMQFAHCRHKHTADFFIIKVEHGLTIDSVLTMPERDDGI
jgi:hypothetical protein